MNVTAAWNCRAHDRVERYEVPQACLSCRVIMTIPYRGTTSCSTYFATAGTYNKIHVLQSERMAELFCETPFRYRDAGKLKVHAFVVMPNHVHLLISVPEGMTLKRVMQLVKGGFFCGGEELLSSGSDLAEELSGSASKRQERV